MPSPTIHHFRSRFVASLWLGVLGCPILWALHLQVAYVLVLVANHTQQTRWHYMTTALFMLLTIACGVVSYRDWSTVRSASADEESSEEAGWTRFLSIMGMVESAFFTLVILVTGSAVYFLKAGWV